MKMIFFRSIRGEDAIDTTEQTSTSVHQPLAAHGNPVLRYLDRLAPGSRRTQGVALDRIAALVSGDEATALDLPWHRLDQHQTERIRSAVALQYAPTTANRMLAALRGVLKEAWQLGLMDADTYHRAAAVQSVPWFISPRGRVLSHEEIEALFAACDRDGTPAGVRDAALLTVLFAAGLRRSEAVALDVRDYHVPSGALTVRATRDSRERVVYAAGGAARALERWIEIRGTNAGPLFVPINRGQKILLREQRMADQSVHRMLQKRGQQAGVGSFSSQDLRRSFISGLLDEGVDIATVQRLAGHCSVLTTQRYDRRDETSRRAIARMREVPMRTTGSAPADPE
ncbi:MAG TPA: tyrosine-type recombinase/integrase [Chloroflexota bacterium]|nr:tyrosine-type recombinase/integrase [Chloroflexota bacterium]